MPLIVPYYKVVIKETNKDISKMVSGLTFEQTVDKDDIVEITINDGRLLMLDKDDFAIGNHIIFNYGIVGRCASAQRLCVIKDPKPTLTNTITFALSGRDLGFNMKKNNANTLYYNKKASDIVTDVCKQHNLKVVIDDSKIVIPMEAQGNLSYFAFCKRLAKEAGASGKYGSFEFYVSGDTAYFKKRDLSKQTRKTFIYKDPASGIIEFSPYYEQPNDSASSKISTQGIDPNGKPFAAKTDIKTNQETATNKGIMMGFNYDGAIKSITGATTTGKIDPARGATDKNGANNIIGGANKDAALTQLVASIKIELDKGIDIEIGDIITIKGAGKRYSGNYQIRKKRDEVTNDCYTEMEGVLNATGKGLGASAKAKNPNDTKGGNTAKKVNYINFNYNGFLKGVS